MPSSNVDGDGPDDQAWSYDTHGRLERVKRHIENNDELTDVDREALAAFEDAMRSYNQKEFRFSDATIGGHLELCFRLAKQTNQLSAMINSDDPDAVVEDVTETIDEMDISDDYKGSFLSALRVYGDLMTDGSMPERFDDLTPSSYINNDPTPLATNILEWQDVIEMVNATDHIRDKALILTAWGAGLRAEAELWKLQYKQIDDRGDHIVISVTDDTKNDYHGAREIHLYAGSAMLRKWLNQYHPAHAEDGPEPETRVWTYHKSDKPVRYQSIWKAFKVAGESAGITKDYNPAHMRRSRASCLARQPMIDEYDLRNFFGWGIKGNSAAHYIAKFSNETAKHVAMADGHSVETFDEPDPIAPLECPTCERWTTRNIRECIWCSAEIPEDRHAIRHTVKGPEEGEKDLLDMLMDDDISVEDLETLQRLEPVVRSRPDIFDEVGKLIELAKGGVGGGDDRGHFGIRVAVASMAIIVIYFLLVPLLG
ncbi:MULTISPECIES: site-specific integrase [Halobacterium]|uniref:site-specific integrase n=1 Tax=Halobacterium TaxID=2239 RepID=UPI00073EDC08|nr:MULTISPECIES: site-specific integrase [Halobacterium]MCG1004989.1 site-specific integrase [Halobacterium noricense]